MSEKLGQEPAFAGSISANDGRDFYEEGMSKRFYAACAAMQGLLSNPERYKYISEKVILGELSQQEATEKNIKKAYYFADELLKQENE